MRRVLTWTILAICILWLVASYLPGVQAKLPVFALKGSIWLAALGVLALLIFVAIQLWLVYTTGATVRHYQTQRGNSPFRLKLSVELFWTALPIVMTIALAWASYALWLNLTKP